MTAKRPEEGMEIEGGVRVESIPAGVELLVLFFDD